MGHEPSAPGLPSLQELFRKPEVWTAGEAFRAVLMVGQLGIESAVNADGYRGGVQQTVSLDIQVDQLQAFLNMWATEVGA